MSSPIFVFFYVAVCVPFVHKVSPRDRLYRICAKFCVPFVLFLQNIVDSTLIKADMHMFPIEFYVSIGINAILLCQFYLDSVNLLISSHHFTLFGPLVKLRKTKKVSKTRELIRFFNIADIPILRIG